VGLHAPLLTADAGYGQVAEFRLGLTERGIRYVVATTSSTTAQPGDAAPVPVPYAGVGKYPQPKYPDPALSVKDLALRHLSSGADTAHLVRWRHRLPGSLEPTGDPDRPADELAGHFFALRIRPAGRAIQRSTHRGQDGVLPQCWLLVEWPSNANEPSDYWLSDLPPDTPLPELVHLAKSRWRIEHDYRELKQAPGPGPLRGPLLDRLAPPRHPRRSRPALPHPASPGEPKNPGAGLSLYAVLRELQYLLATWLGFCPLCHQLVPP
jgi:hypothetical protein